jgi:hypothetical protein
MMRTLYVKILSCLMLVIFPGTLFAADEAAAMLYSHGTALLNGNTIPRTSAIFPGDLVQTTKDSVANINATGSTVLVLNDSLVQYQGSMVTLEHGGLTVSTSRSMATRAEDVNISPASGVLTVFEVRDVDGTVRIVARKGDLNIRDDSGATTTLAQGQETTREESESQKNQKKKKQKGGGAVPGAAGGALNSPAAVGIGIGIVGGMTIWALTRDEDPVSPTVP